MKKKNLTLIFKHFEEEHLGKDVFLVPYYLGTIYNFQVTIVCPDTESNRKLGNNIRGVEIVRIKSKKNISQSSNFYLNINVLKYLIKKAWKIDFLMSIHGIWQVLFMLFIYKAFNPFGKTYLKLDGGSTILSISERSFLKRVLSYWWLNRIDYLSTEIKDTYRQITNVDSIKCNLYHIPNGFDDNLLLETNLIVDDFSKKENIIVTVARLGTYQKNTEMILRAATKINLKNWKIILVGPIEKKEQDFQAKIDSFYKDSPNLKDKVIFTGAIYNKVKLCEYYNSAKVFLLTSISEGYATVYTEAYRFSNYIVTTNVGGAKDTISNGFGEIINNDFELQNTLQSIIDGKIDLNSLYQNCPRKDMSWSNLLKVLNLE